MARTERLLVARGLTSDPASAEGAALAGVRAASWSDGSSLTSSDGFGLPESSCVHHVVTPPCRTRGTAFELAASSAQQAIDHCLAGHALSARLRRAGVCSVDPRLAERLELVSLPGLPALAELLGEAEASRESEAGAVDVLEEARRVLARIARLTGRGSGVIEVEGEAGAELVFAAAGAEAASARAAVGLLRSAGVRAAALAVVLVHPFPEDDVRAALEGVASVVLVGGPGAGSTLLTRLRASVGERARLRVVSAGSPGQMLGELQDLLEPGDTRVGALAAASQSLPRSRLAVAPIGPWSEETLREVLAAASRIGPVRMGARTRLERGATVIDWDGPGDPERSSDLLIASHPAVLETDGLALLRPGGAALVLACAASGTELLGQLDPEVRAALRERAIELSWVPPPRPDEPDATGIEHATGFVLAGAAATLVGSAEHTRAALSGEDEASRWLRRGAATARRVSAAELRSTAGAEEVDFRPRPRHRRLPAAEPAAADEERARWNRAIQGFHRTGRAPVRLGPRRPFRPALLDELVASLRDAPAYPLVVTGTPDPAQPLSARSLHEVLRDATGALPEAGALRTNLGAVVPMALRLLREGGSARLGALLTRLSTALGPELGLGEDEARALREELVAVREALPADARVFALREGLPLELHRAAVEAARAPLRRAFQRRLRSLRERLRDLLQLALMPTVEGHTPQRLAAELGGSAARHVDPEALSRTLPGRSPGLDATRRRRIEDSLAAIEAELARGDATPDPILYFTPPGVELPPGLGRQCEHPDPLAAAVGCFDGAALGRVPLFRAVRIAELELDGRYRPEHHAALLDDLDWQGFTAEELALVPPVAVVTSGRRLRQRALGSLSTLLRSSRPVHVLVRDALVSEDEAEDLSRFHLDLGYLVMAHREAFAIASSLARPESLTRALVRLAKAPRPGVAVVHLPSPGLEPWYPLLAEAALQGRACPEFLYDPDAGPSWAGRFDIDSNPQPARAWPLHRLECSDDEAPRSLDLAFCFADAVSLEPACARHFHVIPRVAWDDETQRTLAEYLDRFDPEGRDRSVPYLWVVDDAGVLQRAIVTRALAMAARDRLRGWRVIQELAGYENAYAERAAAAAREQTLSEAARERSELERAHAEALASARNEGARASMERLAAALIRGDGLALPPAPSPVRPPAPRGDTSQTEAPAAATVETAEAAPEEEDEALPLDEPYVDSPLCTSCNECTGINGRMFRYNADKQAFLADAAAGTFAELVKAAELCPAHCIHVGRPRSDDATATPELIARATAFG